MEEELRCPLCRRFFTKPVLMPCSHSLCVACALSSQEPAQNLLPHGALSANGGCNGGSDADSGTVLSDRASSSSSSSTNLLLDFPDIDKLSIVSETDSGVICNSRPSSYVGTSSVANIFLQSLQSCTYGIKCSVCERLVFLDENGALSLPTNRVLEAIVQKYQKQMAANGGTLSGRNKTEIKCERCLSSDKRAATCMCEQCEVFFCDICRSQCHDPAQDPSLAGHNLVDPAQGDVILRYKRKNSREHKCPEHTRETLTMFCVSCRLPVCGPCAQEGRHMTHDVQMLPAMCKSQKSELSQSLQSLSEKAKSGTEFIQRLKKMADSVSGNCAEFEKTVVSQCDALIEVIKQRKAELLENVAEEKDMKVRALKEQVSDCTALLQRTTGLLQFCIEVLKESDAPSFLQVSAGLVSRVATADANFNKEMELAPRVSPEFELTIDNTAAIHAIENMSFFQMKDGIIAPGQPVIIPEECSCEGNSVTIAWAPQMGCVVEAYTLELDDGHNGDFRVVYVGREMICTVDGLHFNKIYNARVKAHNHSGESEYSEIISLQTAEGRDVRDLSSFDWYEGLFKGLSKV